MSVPPHLFLAFVFLTILSKEHLYWGCDVSDGDPHSSLVGYYCIKVILRVTEKGKSPKIRPWHQDDCTLPPLATFERLEWELSGR